MFFIQIFNKIDIQIGENWLTIKGPKGSLTKWKSPDTLILKKNNKLYLLDKKNNSNKIFYQILEIMQGLKSGYTLRLRLVGIGYKILIEENLLTLRLGFSHAVTYKLPPNISIIQPKPKIPLFILQGLEYDKLTQIASEIRGLKKPEPYKGKGFSYENEIIRRKEGKKNSI